MAKRKVKSKPNLDVDNYDLDNLMNVDILVDEPLDKTPGFSGTSQIETQEEFNIPILPSQLPVKQDEFLVDDVPEIPPGIELLGDIANAEAREDALDTLTETDSPYTLPSKPQYDLQDPLETIRMRIEQEPELNKFLPEETLDMLSQTDKPVIEEEQIIETVPENLPEYGQMLLPTSEEELPIAVQKVLQEKPKKEIKKENIPIEGLGAVPGTVEKGFNDIKIKNTVENLLGIKKGQLPDELIQHAEIFQNVLTKRLEDLNNIESSYKNLMDNNSLSPFDKAAMGIALAMPVILGLAYGKEAFFGSIAGSIQAIGDQQKKKGLESEKILDKLQQIESKRGKIEDSKLSLEKELANSVQNPNLKKFLSNHDILKEIEENGQRKVVLGEDAAKIGDNIGIRVPTESNSLWYNADDIQDDEGLKNFQENSKIGKEVLGKTKYANDVMKDISELMTIIGKQDPKLYDAIRNNIQLIDNLPIIGNLSKNFEKLKVDIVDNNGKVQSVQAIPLLRSRLGLMQDIYRAEFMQGIRGTEFLMKHWIDIFPNPGDIKSWLSSDYPTMVSQSNKFIENLNNRAIENLVSIGFLRQPLEMIYPKTLMNYLSPESSSYKYNEDDIQRYKKMVGIE